MQFKKWILKKYPQAAKYVWERFGARIDAPMIKIGRRHIPIEAIPKRLINYTARKLGFKDKDASIKSMNPVAYYLQTNEELRKYLEDYLSSAKINNRRIQQIINDIRINGSAMEKIEAISLISAIKLYF